MARKVVDCREHPSVSRCSMTMMGEEDELIEAAVAHAELVHQEEDSPKLRQRIRENMQDEARFLAHGVVTQGEQTQRTPAPH